MEGVNGVASQGPTWEYVEGGNFQLLGVAMCTSQSIHMKLQISIAHKNLIAAFTMIR